MDNSLFSGKDQRSYYFLPNSAESISLLRRFLLALQLDINIHTIIRWNDDDMIVIVIINIIIVVVHFLFFGGP